MEERKIKGNVNVEFKNGGSCRLHCIIKTTCVVQKQLVLCYL